MSRSSILFHGAMACDWAINVISRCRTKLPYRLIVDSSEETDIKDEFAVLVASRSFPRLSQLRTLKLMQSCLTGLDGFKPSELPENVPLCNVGGHETAVAEYVIMTLLAWTRSLIPIAANFAHGSWADSSRYGGSPRYELSGKTLGIVGYGLIGRAVAEKATAMNLTVVCCSRQEDTGTHSIATFYTRSDLSKMVERVDFLVIACSLDAQTYRIIDDQILSHIRPGCILINVARAECVDERALIHACESGRLGGAILDVWYNYPPSLGNSVAPNPANIELRSSEKVLATPHISAWTVETIDRRQALVAANIDRVISGFPPENIRVVRERNGA